MSTTKHTVGNTTFYGELAEVAARISDEDWAYFDMVDKLSDMFAEYMEQHNVSKADLARKLGTSRAFVSKVLAGDAHNMTLKTLARFLFGMEARLEFKIVSNSDPCRWLGVVKNENWTSPQLHSWAMKKGTHHVCGLGLSTAELIEKNSVAA